MRMDSTLKLWIEAEAEDHVISGRPNAGRERKKRALLQAFHSCGFAMRRLDERGQVVWKSTPSLLDYLNDLEQDALDDLAED
jgi:hypothetical protein